MGSDLPLGSTASPYDILIVGAGPHALTLLLRLLTKRPYTLYNDQEQSRLVRYCKVHAACELVEKVHKNKYLVVDEEGEWLSRWTKYFNGYDIDYLRSLINVHPDASDASSLRDFAMMHGRLNEIKKIDEFVEQVTRKGRKRRQNSSFNHAQHSALYVPSSSLFMDFCAHLVEMHRLNDVLRKGHVEHIRHLGDDNGFEIVLTENGECQNIYARKVVCAIGNANCLRFPQWVYTCKQCVPTNWPKESLMHSAELVGLGGNCNRYGLTSVPATVPKKKKLMIVGGGLTAAHLVHHGLKRYEHVVMVSRSHFRIKHFDVSLNWVDRHGNVEMAKFWQETDPTARLKMIQRAREGGSITPAVWANINSYKKSGLLTMKPCTEVRKAIWVAEADCNCNCHSGSSPATDGHWEVQLQEQELNDSSVDECDAIWLATGAQMNVREDPLLSKVYEAIPTTLVHGFPVLTHDLRWDQSMPLYVMGGYAALQLGPNSLNLAGAKIASERIVESLQADQENEGLDEAMAVLGGTTNWYDILGQEM